eukprot:1657168-Pleurochrysis_carterae.AAC.1
MRILRAFFRRAAHRHAAQWLAVRAEAWGILRGLKHGGVRHRSGWHRDVRRASVRPAHVRRGRV